MTGSWSGRRRRQSKLPLQFLETPGLENALWPNLYWSEAMCETSIRASDVRRQRRRNAADPAQEVGGPRPEQHRRRQFAAEDSASEVEGEDSGRQSVKKSFMKKVLGPIAGYAEDFELLQFVYDLSLWSRIGGGKNACKSIPGVEGRDVLATLLQDAARGVDRPPASVWPPADLQDHGPVGAQSVAEGKPEQELAGLETLHHAHVFTELEQGLYTGMNKRSSGRQRCLEDSHPWPDRQRCRNQPGPCPLVKEKRTGQQKCRF